MRLHELLAEAKRAGVRLLRAEGGGLTIDAPDGAIDDKLLAALKSHKPALVAIVNAEDRATTLLWQLALDDIADRQALPEAVLADCRSARVRWVPSANATKVDT